MPKTGARKARLGVGIKRFALLAFVMAAAFIALDRTGYGFNTLAAWLDAQDEPDNYPKITRNDCDYLQQPETYKNAMARHRDEVSRSTEILTKTQDFQATELALVPPQEMPRKNFIDNILFDRMGRDNIQSAPLCTDEEFVRRAYLDLTGRIPAAADVTAFLADKNANKRDTLVDALIGTPEFVDKWTMFFDDLFEVNARSTQVQRYAGGRDAFHNYVRNAIAQNKSYKQIATELITANGDNFVAGENNWVVGGTISMGPQQDTMDGTAVNVGTMFLGIQSIDCLLCHDGAGHLDNVNLWGSQRTRAEAWGMSAFFARARRQPQLLSQQPLYRKFIVSENPNGEYLLNTNSGNRSARSPINGRNNIAPQYLLNGGGTVNQGENRRQAIARLVTADKQFARAAVNYIWEKFMVEAFVSPSNSFDPARLDPNAQLPQGWTIQPTNPELLNALADDFVRQNFDLRKLMATIAKSNSYGLSAQYPGTWSLALVPYYARKYVRRLDAEEVHDSILKATGIGVTYTITYPDPANPTANLSRTVNGAMQLPDTIEPRGGGVNGTGAAFLNAFIRGDRDVKPRSFEPSIMQALNLMNSQFVMTRIHQANAGSAVARLLADAALTPEQITTQLYLSTLSRNPTQAEKDALLPLYSSLGRRQAAEGVQWALLNKMDFVFNY